MFLWKVEQLRAHGLFRPELVNQLHNDEGGNATRSRPHGDDNVKMHVFERTIRLSSDQSLDRGSMFPPMQVMLAVKTDNHGKLDSHIWAMFALAPRVAPLSILTIDVGTFADPTGIYRLHYELMKDKECGGCAGVITPFTSNAGGWLVGFQQVEYLLGFAITRAFESLGGFASVLPGAFAAYRYDAIAAFDWGREGPPQGVPTDAHLPAHVRQALRTMGITREDGLSLLMHTRSRRLNSGGFMDELTASSVSNGDIESEVVAEGTRPLNVYQYIFRHKFLRPAYAVISQAEDRLLSILSLLRRDRSYHINFVQEAQAYTDVPATLPVLLRQRKRWINGATLATLWTLRLLPEVWTPSRQTLFRRLYISLVLLYMGLSTVITVLLPAIVYLTNSIFFFRRVGNVAGYGAQLAFEGAYLGVLALQLLVSWRFRPEKAQGFHQFSLVFFGGITLIAVAYAFQSALFDSSDNSILGGKGVMLGIMIVLWSAIFLPPMILGWTSMLLKNFVQYITTQVAFSQVASVYAFVNAHDWSWGTKRCYSTKFLHYLRQFDASIDDYALARVHSRFRHFRLFVTFGFVLLNLAAIAGGRFLFAYYADGLSLAGAQSTAEELMIVFIMVFFAAWILPQSILACIAIGLRKQKQRVVELNERIDSVEEIAKAVDGFYTELEQHSLLHLQLASVATTATHTDAAQAANDIADEPVQEASQDKSSRSCHYTADQTERRGRRRDTVRSRQRSRSRSRMSRVVVVDDVDESVNKSRVYERRRSLSRLSRRRPSTVQQLPPEDAIDVEDRAHPLEFGYNSPMHVKVDTTMPLNDEIDLHRDLQDTKLRQRHLFFGEEHKPRASVREARSLYEDDD
ncbi:MAG: hypothetical protein MHM6MM_000862 [Cercozoa sp. M6MM]